MGKKTKQDPTGQAVNRRKGAAGLSQRLTTAEKRIKRLFRSIPRTRRTQTTLQNSLMRDVGAEIGKLFNAFEPVRDLIVSATIPVYDYQINPDELEELNTAMRRVLDDELLETQFDRMPPNWWWQRNVERPYRQGTAEEITQYNRLVTEELVRIRTEKGLTTQRLEVGSVLLSADYQQALNRVYVENFGSIKTLSDRTADQVIQVLNAGIEAGMTPSELTGLITERFDVSRSSAKRIATTEVNKAYNDAKMNANDIAAKTTGLRSGVLHQSALSPTTRSNHADRHGNAYTTAQQRQWWNTGPNRINCQCSTISVLIDASGKVIQTELQEEIKAERVFFDKTEDGTPPPASPAPKRRRRRRPTAERPRDEITKEGFRADMLRQFGGDFNVVTNSKGNRLAPEVMGRFTELATEYSTAGVGVKNFVISNRNSRGGKVDLDIGGMVETYEDGEVDFFIQSGTPIRKAYASPLHNVTSTPVEAVTHEFAHLLFITKYGGGGMALDVGAFANSELYRKYKALGSAYRAERARVSGPVVAEVSAEHRDGKFKSRQDAKDEIGKRIHARMVPWLEAHEDGDLFISTYAFDSLDETLAEGFAQYKLKGAAGPVAQEVGRLYDKHFKRQ